MSKELYQFSQGYSSYISKLVSNNIIRYFLTFISVKIKLTWIGRLGILSEKALSVAKEAFLLVEYTRIKPCTKSSLKSLAP